MTMTTENKSIFAMCKRNAEVYPWPPLNNDADSIPDMVGPASTEKRVAHLLQGAVVAADPSHPLLDVTIECIRAALELDADNLQARFMLATVLSRMSADHATYAWQLCDSIILDTRRPVDGSSKEADAERLWHYQNALYVRSITRMKRHYFAGALADVRAAINVATAGCPIQPDFYFQEGNLMAFMGEDHPLDSYTKALKLMEHRKLTNTSLYAEVNLAYAIHSMRNAPVLGDWQKAWPYWEKRYPAINYTPGPNHMRLRPGTFWSDLASYGTTLIRMEQGIGDQIMMLATIKWLSEGTLSYVTVKCAPRLVSLAKLYLTDSRVTVYEEGKTGTEFNHELSSFDLLAYGIRGFDRPFTVLPPLRDDEKFRKDAYNIAMAYQGNPLHGCDWDRSIPRSSVELIHSNIAYALSHCLKRPVFFHRLDLNDFRYWPHGKNLGNTLYDMEQVANAVSHCDAVVTVDTALAHIAGAMHKPTALLLSKVADWRWGVGTDSSPIYPTVRLFRQGESGNWHPPAVKINEWLKHTLRSLNKVFSD